MPLKLMYLTHDPEVATIAQDAGVDWIFVDLEIIGKHARQGHLDTVISGHTVSDVRAVRAVVDRAQLLVRVNPLHDGSPREIDEVIDAGADIVMLPFFHHSHEAAEFVRLVAGRAQVCLLVETPLAVENLDAVLAVPGIDYVHVGLNDLHLGYGLPFMFDLLADGTVERVCRRVGRAGIPYGFGGIARLGLGDLPAEAVVAEHYRLGSSMAILSRSFCNVNTEPDLGHVAQLFAYEVARIRDYEAALAHADEGFFRENCRNVVRIVRQISDRRAGRAAPDAAVPVLHARQSQLVVADA